MNETIKIKLDEIADCLENCINHQQTTFETPSLYGGNGGTALFFAYYNKYKQDKKSEELFENVFDKCLEAIGNGFYFPTYCSGLSGVLYGIQFFNEKGFADIDIEEAHDAYMPFLENSMLQYINHGNYDFMHGAIGIALYFLKSGGEKNHQACVKLVDELESIAVKENDTMKWLYEDIKKEKCFNIAMSHGMSSIAVFLTRMIKANVDSIRCAEMLRLTINYILQQEYDKDEVGSYFPHTSLEAEGTEKYKSRMAWCYGDLGVASAIWQAGCVLNNEAWKEKSIEVFEFATTRRNLEGELVIDAGLCHGTAGVAQLFMRMYLDTGNETFAQANEYWIQETLKMAKWEDGFAGYKKWSGSDKEKEWQTDDSFLEGIAGIALPLLAYLNRDNRSFSDWDEVLLIS